MRKFLTSLGCMLALAVFSLPANAQNYDYTYGQTVTFGGTGGVTKCTFGTSSSGYLTLVSNLNENLVDNFTVGRVDNPYFAPVLQAVMTDVGYAYEVGFDWGDGFTPWELSDINDVEITYTGSVEVKITFSDKEAVPGAPAIDIELGNQFTLGGDGNATKANFFEERDGDKSKDFAVYLLTNSRSDILGNGLSIMSSGASMAGDWATIQTKDGYYAYNGRVSQNITYNFNYSGDTPVNFLLDKGSYTQYGQPAPMEETPFVVAPMDGNQYVLELPAVMFNYPDMSLAKVVQKLENSEEIYSIAQFFRGAANVAAEDDSEAAPISLVNYANGQVNEEGQLNTVSVDVSYYTVYNGTDVGTEDLAGLPVPGVYMVKVLANSVVNTANGEQNTELVQKFTILPGISGTSQTTTNKDGVATAVSVTFPGESMKENETASLNCTMNGSMVPVTLNGMSVTFNLEGLEAGDYTLQIPAAMYIITNESGTTGEGEEEDNTQKSNNEDVAGLYLNNMIEIKVNVGQSYMADPTLVFNDDEKAPNLILYWDEPVSAINEGPISATVVTPTNKEVSTTLSLISYYPKATGPEDEAGENALQLQLADIIDTYGAGKYSIQIGSVVKNAMNAWNPVYTGTFEVAAEIVVSKVKPTITYSPEQIVINWNNNKVSVYNPENASIYIVTPDWKFSKTLSVGSGVSIVADNVIIDVTKLDLVDGTEYQLLVPEAYFYIGTNNEVNDAIDETFTYDTTGINSIGSFSDENTVIYNLNGVRVDGKNLNKGLYIVNGKKVMITK